MSPDLIDKAVQRIRRGLKEEPVYLFGDGDLDGVAAVVAMEEAIGGRGEVFCFFNNRERWGYGLSSHYLERLEKKKPGLLLIFDCGTGNRKEVRKAKEMGFSVIIVDHHRSTGPLPPAHLIVNPALKQDSPFKNLCAGALSVELARAFLNKEGREGPADFLSFLAMVSTVSDQMPRDEKNEEIIEKGISALERTKRAPLVSLLEVSGLEYERLTVEEMERYFIPLLSSATHRNEKSEAYLFLKENSLERARRAAALLKKKRALHKERTGEIVEEVERRADPEMDLVFEGDEDWPLFLAARAASRLVSGLEKPVFLYHRGEEESQGSCRAPSEYDLLEMMKPCSDLLVNWGGHPRAAGFGVKNRNLSRFEKRLIKNMR